MNPNIINDFTRTNARDLWVANRKSIDGYTNANHGEKGWITFSNWVSNPDGTTITEKQKKAFPRMYQLIAENGSAAGSSGSKVESVAQETAVAFATTPVAESAKMSKGKGEAQPVEQSKTPKLMAPEVAEQAGSSGSAAVEATSSLSEADKKKIDHIPSKVTNFLNATYDEAKESFDAILNTLPSNKAKLEQKLEKGVARLVAAGIDEDKARYDLWRITAAQHHITTNYKGVKNAPVVSVTAIKKPEGQVSAIIEYTTNLILRRQMPYFDQNQAAREIEAFYEDVDLGDYESMNAKLVANKKDCQTRIKFWSDVERQPDGTLRCAYTNELLETSEGIRFLKSDEEHVTPQSWHQGSGTLAGNNLHTKFATGKSANGSRGNKAFSSDYAPAKNQGAVARTTLYMFLQNKGIWHHEKFTKKNLDWLIEAARNNEPTLWEKARNERIAKMQGIRNPFVDFPRLIDRLDAEFFNPAFSQPLSQ